MERRQLLCTYTLPASGSPASTQYSGPIATLALRVEFNDNRIGTIEDTEFAQQLVWINQQYDRVSNQQLQFAFKAPPIIRLSDAPSMNSSQQLAAAKSYINNKIASDPLNWSQYNPSLFEKFLLYSPTTRSEAELGGNAWVNNAAKPVLPAGNDRTVLHELGHTLWWKHSSHYEPDKKVNALQDVPAIAGGGAVAEYMDPYDFMGLSSLTSPDVSNVRKHGMGWLTDENIPIVIATDSIFKIYQSDAGGAPSSLSLGARVPIVAGSDKYYWLEYRQKFSIDPNLTGAPVDRLPLNGEYAAKGIQLYWTEYVSETAADGIVDGGADIALLDMNPAHLARVRYANGTLETPPTAFTYQLSRTDALMDSALTVGQSFNDPWANVTISTLGVGSESVNGTLRKYAEVRVRYGAPNAAPTVSKLNLPLGKVTAGQNITISATATDPNTGGTNGDTLSYLWEIADPERGWRRQIQSTAGASSFTTNLADVNGTVKPGTYQVMVRVSDGTGNVVTKSGFIEVTGDQSIGTYVRVSGRVVSSNGTGIANVCVVGSRKLPGTPYTILVDSTFTDQDGYYSFLRDAEADASYQIFAMDAKFEIAPIEDSSTPITSSARTRVDFLVTPKFTTVGGQIETDVIPRGERFSISVGPYQTFADYEGKWSISVPAGRYGLSGSYLGQALSTPVGAIADATGSTTSGYFRATPPASRDLPVALTGYTTSSPPAVIFQSSFGLPVTNDLTSSPAASLTLDDFVNVGRVYVWVRRSGSNSWSTTNNLLTIPAATDPSPTVPTVVFTQNQPATSAIYGRVLGANGPSSSGTAQLYKNGSAEGNPIPIDDNGFYYFGGLSPANYYVIATVNGVNRQTATTTLASTDSADKSMGNLFEPAAPTTPSVTQLSLTGFGSLIQLTASSVGADVRYEWETVGLPSNRFVTFSKNGTQGANVVEARFSHAGTYNLRVRVIDRFGRPSETEWQPVTVVVGAIVDKVKPKLRRVGFAYLTTEQAFEFQFTEKVHDNSGGLPSILVPEEAGSITITNLVNGHTFTQGEFDTSWNAATHTLRLTPKGEADLDFNNGVFAVTVIARVIKDDGNNTVTTLNGSETDTDIFIFRGDANHDGNVNFDDLLVVAQNYGMSGRNWSTGDFNYDEVCNFDDLLILAQSYGSTWLGEDLDGDGDSDIADFVMSLS